MPDQPIPQTVAETPEARPDPLAVAVARAVADLRRAAGLSERAAARALRTSQTQLRRMEDPRYLPSLRSLSRLATAYGQRIVVTFEPLQPRGGARERATPGRKVSASGSPSKAPRAVPGRARGAARARPRRTARRRRK